MRPGIHYVQYRYRAKNPNPNERMAQLDKFWRIYRNGHLYAPDGRNYYFPTKGDAEAAVLHAEKEHQQREVDRFAVEMYNAGYSYGRKGPSLDRERERLEADVKLYKDRLADVATERDQLAHDWDLLLQGMEAIGWPCRAVELPAEYQRLVMKIYVLRDILRRHGLDENEETR